MASSATGFTDSATSSAAATQGSASVPTGPVDPIGQDRSVEAMPGIQDNPVFMNAHFAQEGDKPGFVSAGAFRINAQWVTAIRYEAHIKDGAFMNGTVKFMNGRKQVMSMTMVSREQAVETLGERNVENIEAGKGKEKDGTPGTAKGKLQSEYLAHKETYTPDKHPENTVETTPEREVGELDADVGAWVAKRREKMARAHQQGLQSERIGETEDIVVPTARPDPDKLPAKGRSDDSQADRLKAIPASVKERFIQVDNKYYFLDKTPAFEDRETKLATRSENQEVVRTFVAIAHARGWGRVTVRGTEDFRRATWLEASLFDIEVSGYKPSKVETAYLAKLRERTERKDVDHSANQQQVVTSKLRLGNAIKQPESSIKDQRRDRKGARTEPNAEAVASAVTAESIRLRAGVVAGQLIEHGETHYQHDPKNEKSYFVKLETARGVQTVWGVDLKRAVAASGVTIGEKITLEKQGSKPVIARERMVDEKNKVIGERPIDARRNQWFVGSLDKAEAFAHGDRADVVRKYPDLAPAYGTISAARKFAERQFQNSKEDQALFVVVAQRVIAEKIAHGESVPTLKIREMKVQERPRQQGRDDERNASLPVQTKQGSDRDRAR